VRKALRLFVNFIGGRHAQGEQMPECIDRQMDLTAFPTFSAVIASAPSALGRRLQGPTIKDCGSRPFFTHFGDPQDGAQVTDERLEDAGFDPALRLLIDDIPGRQVMGIKRHCAPVRTIQRKPLKTSRNGKSRCGASSVISVGYGATKTHSSLLTPLG
jgi:hypothetical protein